MSTNIFSGTLFGIAALLLALTSAFASDITASQENRSELSPRQQQVIRNVFSRQDREGTNWHYFTFECQQNPVTSRTASFTANITKTESFRYQSF